MHPRLRLNWPFTATPTQVTSYLLFVALFSIAFLVFLNATISLLIRDLLHLRTGLGNAVGTLGFADELLALVACPAWGVLSDRVGTRTVVTVGYAIIGVSLFVFVQARNVYPDLLLARLLFSLGGAAATTMVTAILPSLTADRGVPKVVVTQDADDDINDSFGERHETASTSGHRTTDSASTARTETTITPANYQPSGTAQITKNPQTTDGRISQIAGVVGMFTGTGALVALGIFLPLPAWLQKAGQTEPEAVKSSFYIVGSIALFVAAGCFIGLRLLPGEESKGWRTLLPKKTEHEGAGAAVRDQVESYARLTGLSLKLAITDASIFLGCVGGFVARASSVGISTFIPLFINAYFINSGLCKPDGSGDPSEIKEQCRRAYTLAAALTGVGELVALLAAPVFGYLDSKYWRWNVPLLVAAAAGLIGYSTLANTQNPDPRQGGGTIFLTMALIGISQIGAIVCSLSVLGRGINHQEPAKQGAAFDSSGADTLSSGGNRVAEEERPLLNGTANNSRVIVSRQRLKGSIAGLYSLAGGAGILLLTKLGGHLFDKLSHGAPFYMMAIFNGILFVVALLCTYIKRRQGDSS